MLENVPPNNQNVTTINKPVTLHVPRIPKRPSKLDINQLKKEMDYLNIPTNSPRTTSPTLPPRNKNLIEAQLKKIRSNDLSPNNHTGKSPRSINRDEEKHARWIEKLRQQELERIGKEAIERIINSNHKKFDAKII